MPDLPLVTVVTPSFNMARFLPEAIESVLSQDYPRLEMIVMDGGSTDGTADLLRTYGGRLRWVAEPDDGPADAIDRGFAQAAGSILAWLNADDRWLPGAVRTAAEHLMTHPETDVVYGEAHWINEQGVMIRRYPTLAFDAKLLETDCFICQPAAFLRRSSYLRCGLDCTVKCSFDYDLWIRMSKAGFRFEAIPQYLAASRMHRGAKTFHEREQVFQDSMHLLKRHYGYIPFQWVYGYAAYRMDGRDQFFEPIHHSVAKYLASLPLGFKYNPTRALRFLGEWLAAGKKALSSGGRHRGHA